MLKQVYQKNKQQQPQVLRIPLGVIKKQESNKKYNELLTEKLNSEDALKIKFETEKAALIKEWQAKC